MYARERRERTVKEWRNRDASGASVSASCSVPAASAAGVFFSTDTTLSCEPPPDESEHEEEQIPAEDAEADRVGTVVTAANNIAEGEGCVFAD